MIKGKTMKNLYNNLKTQFESDRVGFKFKRNKKELQMTWKEIAERVQNISLFFIKEGIQVQDKIGIFSNNMPEWSLVDFACLETRACSVPLYPTTNKEHLVHIINDAQVKILFVGDEKQKEKVDEVIDQCPTLEKVILMKSDEFDNIANSNENFSEDLHETRESRINSIQKEDLVTLIYTSGTTGMPKGVMLDNENFAAGIESHRERIDITSEDTSMCFLPLSHIFERAWTYFIMSCDGVIYYLEDPSKVALELKTAKPTVMCSVPRFFEKVYTQVQSGLDEAPSSKRNVFKWATRIGRKVFSRKANNEIVGPLLYLQHKIATKIVYSKFKDNFGGNIRFFNCGGASLQDDVNMFFQSLSVPIIYGYGMTETMATVACYTKIPAIGTVGKCMPGVKVRIDKDTNEIQVSGKTVTKGYYNLPEANAESFTEDGWLKTGDAGRLDAEGNLFYTERIKDLMKTSNSKYIAPQNVESTLLKDKFIDQVAVIAEGKTFVSALIVPDYEALEKYAHETAIEFKNKAELLSHVDIQKMLKDRVKSVQEQLNDFEKVKKFKLLEKPFSVLENEITPTLKIKRKVVAEKYAHFIDDLYNKGVKNKKSVKPNDDVNKKDDIKKEDVKNEVEADIDVNNENSKHRDDKKE